MHLNTNNRQAFETRRWGFHPPSWSATEAFPSPFLMFWWHHWHPHVTSVTPSAAKHWLSTQGKLTEYPVSRPEPRTSLISQHANLNSMIQQYWIYCFSLGVKWAQVWRTSNVRARQHQGGDWSCHRANITLRGCSCAALKPGFYRADLLS